MSCICTKAELRLGPPGGACAVVRDRPGEGGTEREDISRSCFHSIPFSSIGRFVHAVLVCDFLRSFFFVVGGFFGGARRATQNGRCSGTRGKEGDAGRGRALRERMGEHGGRRG